MQALNYYRAKQPHWFNSAYTITDRTKFLARCPAESTHNIQLINHGTGDVVSSSKLVVMANTAVGAYDPTVLSEWSPRRPYYLTDLSEGVVVDHTFNVDLKFTGEINKKSFRKNGEPLVRVSCV